MLEKMTGFVVRSVVCFCLVALLSIVQGQMECADLRYPSFDEQLGQLNKIVSTMKKTRIKAGCTVTLASYGYHDSTVYGYVRTNGGSSDETYTQGHFDRDRGVIIFELNPTTCTTRNRRRFDTYSSALDGQKLLEAMQSAAPGTIIVGVTADSAGDFESYESNVRSYFARYNLNLVGYNSRDKFTFIMQKAYPKKTVFEKKPNGGESLKTTIALRGSTVSGVTFHRV